VLACPTSARLFGDIHDPQSEVSLAIAERGGYQLMPEWGTNPSNHYLPRRKTTTQVRDNETTRQDNARGLDAQMERGELNLAAAAQRTQN